MRRLVPFIVLLATLGAGATLADATVALAQPQPAGGAATPASAPRLVIAERSVDLGSVREGETARAVFTLRNEGNAPLEIRSAKPS